MNRRLCDVLRLRLVWHFEIRDSVFFSQSATEYCRTKYQQRVTKWTKRTCRTKPNTCEKQSVARARATENRDEYCPAKPDNMGHNSPSIVRAKNETLRETKDQRLQVPDKTPWILSARTRFRVLRDKIPPREGRPNWGWLRFCAGREGSSRFEFRDASNQPLATRHQPLVPCPLRRIA